MIERVYFTAKAVSAVNVEGQGAEVIFGAVAAGDGHLRGGAEVKRFAVGREGGLGNREGVGEELRGSEELVLRDVVDDDA